MTATAIGFLRTDISGTRQPADESRLRATAEKLGYDLRKVVALSPYIDQPLYRLRVTLSRLGSSTLITPSLHHFDGEIPSEISEVADVITVNPEVVHMRTPIRPPLTLGGITFTITPELEALLSSAAEIAEAGGQAVVGVGHVLLALLRNPEMAVGPLRDIGIGPDVYGARLGTLSGAARNV